MLLFLVIIALIFISSSDQNHIWGQELTHTVDDVNQYDISSLRYSQLPTTPSNALTISGDTPYLANGYYLSSGSSGYVKLIASHSYYFSVYTEGSLDTQIEVYSNVSCTNLVTSSYIGGHGNNALIYTYISSGSTYYIKIKGYTNSVSGNYTLILHKGLPTSRYEKGDMFSIFNNSNYLTYNNCYTYVLGFATNPVTGTSYSPGGINPGGFANSPIGFSDLANYYTAKNAIENALTNDCQCFGGDWAEISENVQPRIGYYKAALVLAPNQDFHWYRELYNGQWGHKPSTLSARNYDFSNVAIYNPSNCNRDGSTNNGNMPNYTVFIGWYELKTIYNNNNNDCNNDIDLEIPNDEKTSSLRYDISMAEIKNIKIDTSYDDIVAVLGEPHDVYGSGFIGNMYILDDGSKIVIYFSEGWKLGGVTRIYQIFKDGSFEILLQ